ncbi:hypothetical protein G6F57_017851 [Rhizopus arrhizus]|nr:hypothetical protein G6F57_017851 [Rhizopus arrhizus]
MDLGFGAYVHAARGFVHQQHGGVGGQQFGDRDLLLVAARQAGGVDGHAVGLELEPRAQFRGPAPCRAAPQQAEPRTDAGQRHRRYVLFNGKFQEQARRLAVFAEVGDAMAQGVAVAADAQRFASQPHAAAPRAPQAAQGLGQFAAPGAHQARDAQDLAAIERERDAVHADVVGDAVDFKQGGGVTACRQFGRVVAAQFPPDHAAHQRIRRQARQRGADAGRSRPCGG